MRLFYDICTNVKAEILFSPVDTFIFYMDSVEYIVTFRHIGCWYA